MAIIKIFKEYTSFETPSFIREPEFVIAMEKINKFVEKEDCNKYLYKIFKMLDQDQDKHLSITEFRKLMKNYEARSMNEREVKATFNLILKLQPNSSNKKKSIDWITFKKFIDLPKDKLYKL